MIEDSITKDALIKRLRRIEGQVRGVQRMIENDSDCESVMTQISAVRSAIESVGVLVLIDYMNLSGREGEETASSDVESLARAISIWGRVHTGGKAR